MALRSIARRCRQTRSRRTCPCSTAPIAASPSSAGRSSRRNNINRELGFSEADRIEHARRMGWLCDQVVKAGGFAIADFICPTPAARAAFSAGAAPFVIWVDRIKSGPYDDTNRLFVPPEHV